MTRVLITGVTGFIGSELARALAADGFEVTGLVRTTSNKTALDPIKDLLTQMEIRYGNLTDYAAVRKIVKDIAPQYIIHVGAATAVRHSFENPLEYQEVDYLATVNLAHAALEVPGFKKFLFASTMEVYGWQEKHEPFTEETTLHPASPYAAAKYAAEEYVRMAGKAFGLPYIVLRCCNTFGRKNNAGFVTEYLVTSMLKGETTYLGTPDAVRDMMYVDDHVNAYVTALKSKVVNETFVFGTGNKLSMKELALKIKEMTGFKGELVFSFPPDYPWRPVVEPFLSLHAAKAQRMLGWTPKYNVEEGLRKTVEWWKNVRQN